MTNITISDAPAQLTLDQQLDEPAVPATQDMPTELLEMLDESGFFVRSQSEPKFDFETAEVPGVPGMWKVLQSPHGEELTTVIPGGKMIRRQPAGVAAAEEASTDNYRPPWIPFEYVPRLRPFRIGKDIFLEPTAAEDTNRLSYPNCCVGLVKVNGFSAGTGVLVGPNLMLTAGHIVPWGSASFSMEFLPAFRPSDARPPFGKSFVIDLIGYDPAGEVAGYDYAICQLRKPLGQAAGWMGSRSFGDEDSYYQRRYNSSGYGQNFGDRMAIELNMGLKDIDNDDPGLELEFALRNDIQPGWSGGPLWLPNEDGPRVMGVLSGDEKDGFDPTRLVFAGGKGMVDLIKEGLATWPL